MRPAPLILMLQALISLPAAADGGSSVQYVPAAQIAQALSQPMTHGAIARQLNADVGTPVWAIKRDGAVGEVELHKMWNDVIIEREGDVTILIGEQVEGNREIKPSEWLGGKIVGGTTYTLKPGDLLFIPAGLGHQMTGVGGKPFSYLVIKTPAHKP
jgi:hypothetical protein